jgi:hypothetical protein
MFTVNFNVTIHVQYFAGYLVERFHFIRPFNGAQISLST